SISMSYNSYKVMSDKNFYVSRSNGLVNNCIVSSMNTHASGVSTYQSINMKDKNHNNHYMYSDYGQKIGSSGFRIGIEFDASGSTYYNYINNTLNQTKTHSFSPSLNLSYYRAKKMNIDIYGGPSYIKNVSSLQKELNNNGWGANAGMTVN